jgi:hypothetical protein
VWVGSQRISSSSSSCSSTIARKAVTHSHLSDAFVGFTDPWVEGLGRVEMGGKKGWVEGPDAFVGFNDP